MERLSIPTPPADLIRVAVPRLNKNDHIREYLAQLETRDYDITYARVTETKVLTCAEWNDFVTSLLEDRDWLAEKGGAASWVFDTFEDGRHDWLHLTEAEKDLWRKTSYLLVVAVSCGGQTIYVDPEGYNYARYLAFSADFDDDKFRVCPNHPLYSLVKPAYDAQEAHHAKRLAKRLATRGY